MSMGKSSDGGAGKMAKSEKKSADAAAKKITEYGDQAVSFTNKFFDDYIKPQLTVIQTERDKGIQRADQVFEQQQAQFQDREGTYQQVGKPAINNYFKQVDEFDPEAEAQRQGLTMTGDVTAGIANAQAQSARALQARGINPTSGQAINALGRTDTAGALVKAREMARLRSLTNQQKMGMVADAAKFGAGLGEGTVGMPGQSLQSGVIGSDVATQSTGALTAGSGIPLAGLELASQGQGQIFTGSKSAQASAQNAATQAAANDGGIGGIVGTVAGGLISKLPMFSDRRLKQNITRLGTRPDGINVYAFNYVWDAELRYGYMADEVERVYPSAVSEVGGYKMVDYSKVEQQPW